jgi:polysaccharide biosynthesis protein PslH
MRILYLTFSFQHPTVRGPNRHYHFLRGLSERHAITFLTIVRSQVSAEAMNEVASYTERLLIFPCHPPSESPMRVPASSLPLVGARLDGILRDRESVRQMKRSFRELVEKERYDVVLFHGKAIYPVIDQWNGLPIVADFCDATSMRLRTQMRYVGLAKRSALAFFRWQIRQVEQRLIRQTPHVAFISPRDREAIMGPGSQAVVLPNGVDLQYWHRGSDDGEPNCIVFHGGMNYSPNHDAAGYLIDRILPLVRRSIPHLRVFIVGRDPSPALMEKVQRHPDVTVTGFVEDVRPYLERAAVYVAPLRIASGMQNKLLEALAMGAPPVATSVAAAGLRMDGGAEPPLLVADGERPFAERVVRLLRDEEERRRLAAEGQRFVATHFVWSRSVERLEQLCREAVAQWPQRQHAGALARVS